METNKSKIEIIGNNAELNTEGFWENFWEQLEKEHQFPYKYMFKLIINADKKKETQ
jgi:hypothetical protein